MNFCFFYCADVIHPHDYTLLTKEESIDDTVTVIVCLTRVVFWMGLITAQTLTTTANFNQQLSNYTKTVPQQSEYLYMILQYLNVNSCRIAASLFIMSHSSLFQHVFPWQASTII